MTANYSKDKKLNFYGGVTKLGHILFSNKRCSKASFSVLSQIAEKVIF
ncbi:hypothetical protein CU025_1128 [Enterococcus faecium]|nr:hypothetical protein [Enterococcus faecium]MBK4766568.1 hypothetical protein [Enterococcus faecium]MBK4800629.1 hypothetical protein [Enterococcus faecium]MBK4811337.1 hypothetical protein [Enterococcus faecium]MBK4822115.1 hypothetical protein [Enterococcus faecium]